MSQSVHFKASVSEVIAHSPDVHSYTLVSERSLPKFSPGQFIHLSLEMFDPSNYWPESRVFSVANTVIDNKTIKLVISKQGLYTKRIIEELHVGSYVSCKGPYGDFIIRTDNQADKTIVMIAGGTGITPFSAFMESLMQHEVLGFSRCFLFYGTRMPALLIYKKLADACSVKFNNFKAMYFSEEDDPGKKLTSEIRTGRLNVNSVVDSVKPDNHTIFYLSGPKMMIDYFSNELTKVYQYPAENILIDAW
jgi:ferredoxin-NADP reductase